MLRTIHLSGELADKFKPEYKLDVSSISEAVRAINALTQGKFIRALNLQGYYRCVRGKDLNDESKALSQDTLDMSFSDEDFYICPVPAGSGDNGWLNVILGIVLVVVAIYGGPPGWAISGYGAGTFSGAVAGGLVSLGVGLVLTGVSQLLTPMMSTDYAEREDPDERPSFLFNGPTNTIEQGGPVPIVYGHMKIGSTVISSALEVEDI